MFHPLNSFQDVWCIHCCKLQFFPETPVLIICNIDKKSLTETRPPALLTATWFRQLAAKLQAAIIIYHNSWWTCQRFIFYSFLFLLFGKSWLDDNEDASVWRERKTGGNHVNLWELNKSWQNKTVNLSKYKHHFGVSISLSHQDKYTSEILEDLSHAQLI